MSNYADAPESAVKRSVIQELVNQVKANEETLPKLFDDLLRKIEPIINPKGASETNKEQEALAAYSPLAKDLQGVAQKQLRNIRRLELIIEDIEL